MPMEVTDEDLFEAFIAELEERTKPSKNDKRYERYVNYINCFISKFGRERVYLVGSTSERSKLAFSKDDGDADFLMVSGKMEIPAENLVSYHEAPCFVWIRADSCSRDIGLEVVEDEYISANTLREVRPELFTMLRAIYLHVTATVNKLPETDTERTILSVSSKVGLQTTTYRSLKFEENIEDLKEYFINNEKIERENEKEKLLEDRWKQLKVNECEKKIYRRLYEASKLAIPSDRKKNNGGIAFFVQLVEEILARQSGALPKTPSDEMNNFRTNHDNNTDHNSSNVVDIASNKDKLFRATYEERSHKDFVPALVITGELEDMRLWKKRVLDNGWDEERVNDICDTEIFVVSRVCPKSSNPEKDFCLSFNLAERKLMIAMSYVERRVYLILKAFLKGVFGGASPQCNYDKFSLLPFERV
ncbi:uncharacterized protein LOC132754579 [Ruditapes philippinarum]|uniref:uncharacterized protein LOC132754579 n=1 Tax=Ruditapes philippinarum TaxID=129788 RepID=UPI00295B076D|nr:uncharacterized protein LOC132754579 [Ruditapes philippinarum]